MTIPFDGLRMEGDFPAVVTSQKPVDNFENFSRIIQENRPSIEQALLKHGALLFRGFPVTCAKDFSLTIESLGFGKFVNYIGGDSPRDKVENGVYTSTEAPPSFHIPLHQELSFIKHFPRHIYFYCDIAPVARGETIIADARRVYHAFDNHFIKKFDEKGLTYISRYYYQSKIMEWVNRLQRSHKSWIEVFETYEKKEVEQKCLDNDFMWRWLRNDWLEIKQNRPAICSHPLTQETVWFNQAHLYDFNPRLLGIKRYIGAKLFYFQKRTRLHEIQFRDGTLIPRQDLYYILDTLNKNTVYFPWQKGDVLVLDNILAMHGRAPFSGKRRILTALTT